MDIHFEFRLRGAGGFFLAAHAAHAGNVYLRWMVCRRQWVVQALQAPLLAHRCHKPLYPRDWAQVRRMTHLLGCICIYSSWLNPDTKTLIRLCHSIWGPRSRLSLALIQLEYNSHPFPILWELLFASRGFLYLIWKAGATMTWLPTSLYKEIKQHVKYISRIDLRINEISPCLQE
jgi:hypothetical protein